MKEEFLAVVNPVAGHRKCGKLARLELRNLQQAGVKLEVVETRFAGHGVEIVRKAYQAGFRRFLAVGGDGTAYEIVNGLFPGAEQAPPPTLAMLPLGTGNSFLRDFVSKDAARFASAALLAGRTRPCDVLRMTHRDGVIHFINLLSVGFAADAAAVTNRSFKQLGHVGYLFGVFTCLLRLNRRAFPVRVDDESEIDRRRCLFLSFNNSKFTGRTMMIAPQADTADGLIEYVRWGPIGRAGLVRNLRGLYDGSHLAHPLASRRTARRVEFYLDGPVDAMVDGEVLTLECKVMDVLPAALNVMV